ncbi:MAG: CbiQ family ECF transporter T component, partial [Microbacterium sp.]
MITALEQVNPLAKYGAVLPIFLVVILSKSLAMPVGVGLASLLLLFLLSRQPFRIWAAVLTAVPGLAVLFMFTLAVWIPAPPGETPLFALGSVAWHSTSLEISAATGARISAILALALMVGLTTDTRGLVRAAV